MTKEELNKYICSLKVDDETIDQALGVVMQLDGIPKVEYVDDSCIVLKYKGNHHDRLDIVCEGEPNYYSVSAVISDGSRINKLLEEAEIAPYYSKFMENKLKTWMDYKLRKFKAIQWLGDNLDEVRALVHGDPDSACWVETKEIYGDKINVLHVSTNDYCENCCHELVLYPEDYLVSWGDHYKKFNYRFFPEMFELVGE